VPAVAAEPADHDPLTDLDTFDARTDLGDRPGDLVAGGDRPVQVGEGSADEGVVGAAHPAGGDVHPHVPGPGRGGVDVDQLEGGSGGPDLHGAMGGHAIFSTSSRALMIRFSVRTGGAPNRL
jgi:hypothetical protein